MKGVRRRGGEPRAVWRSSAIREPVVQSLLFAADVNSVEVQSQFSGSRRTHKAAAFAFTGAVPRRGAPRSQI